MSSTPARARAGSGRSVSPGAPKASEDGSKKQDTGKQPNETPKKAPEALKLKHFFYVANIIDYGRVVFLVLAMKSEGWWFALYYILSYALDAIDGIAARMLNQESQLGYWLDMIIDRISSSVCLYFAAKAVQAGATLIPPELATLVAFALIVCIILVEIFAHGVVMFVADVMGIHQKKLGGDWKVVRWYLGLEEPTGKAEKDEEKTKKSKTNWMLLWACASFEFFGVGLIVNNMPMVLLSTPGFIFRAVANIARLLACVPILRMPKEERSKLKAA